jgi:hypothetical protein
VRATLNLGHTFGHAIETATGYGTFLHGEAVSIGMVMAADMSVRLVSWMCERETASVYWVLIFVAGVGRHLRSRRHWVAPATDMSAWVSGRQACLCNVSNGGTFLHGEAVSNGMVMAADMSVRLVSGNPVGRAPLSGERILYEGSHSTEAA